MTGAELPSELDVAADQLTAWLRSMTDVRVGMHVVTAGMGELAAYETAKAQAARLVSWADLTELRLDANEPEPGPDGLVQVGVLVGVTALDPASAVRSACAELDDRVWDGPHALRIAEHQFAVWCADPAPAEGPVRVEVHAAPGLAFLTERRRREMLDDPDYAHLHHRLRQDG